MSWEIVFVFGLLVFALLVAMGFLPGENSLPDLGELLTVFSNLAS